MKNKVIQFLKSPIFQLIFSLCFCIVCFVVLSYIVQHYPNAIDDELFLLGCRWGFWLFGLMFGIFFTGLCLVDFGIWLHKRKITNGSFNSKD